MQCLSEYHYKGSIQSTFYSVYETQKILFLLVSVLDHDESPSILHYSETSFIAVYCTGTGDTEMIWSKDVKVLTCKYHVLFIMYEQYSLFINDHYRFSFFNINLVVSYRKLASSKVLVVKIMHLSISFKSWWMVLWHLLKLVFTFSDSIDLA